VSTSTESMKSLRQSFIAGLLALLPLYITGRILLFLFELVDGPLGNRINELFKATLGLSVHIPGLGLIGTLLIVVAVGWLMRMVLFQRVMGWLEEAIGKLPLVRSLYSASRQIVVPFTDQSKLPFSQVVLVEYPMKGRWTLGLVAKAKVTDDPNDPRMVVFFPSNHLHLGYPVMLSRHEVQEIDMTVEEAVKFFVSCGVVGDDRLLLQKGVQLPWPQMALTPSLEGAHNPTVREQGAQPSA
jgi:uncharacterized membrane protein